MTSIQQFWHGMRLFRELPVGAKFTFMNLDFKETTVYTKTDANHAQSTFERRTVRQMAAVKDAN